MEDSDQPKPSVRKKFLNNLILMKELPYGFVLLIGVLGFVTSEVWDDHSIYFKRVSSSEYPGTEKEIRAQLLEDELHGLDGQLGFCDATDPSFLHRLKLKNISLDGKMSDSIRINIGYNLPGEMLLVSFDVRSIEGSPDPYAMSSFDYESKIDTTMIMAGFDCQEANYLLIKNFGAGDVINLKILSSNQNFPVVSVGAVNSDFQLIPHSWIRAMLFDIRSKSDLLVPILIVLLISYFILIAYVKAKES